MPFVNPDSTWSHFITSHCSDPDVLTHVADIEAVEQTPQQVRFPCSSPNAAITTIAEHFPDKIALTYLPTGSIKDDPIRWTYQQYREEIIVAANLFHSLGLLSHESVGFLLPNIPQMLFGLWGAQALGIASPMNPFLETEQIASIAEEADTRIIVTLAPNPMDSGELLKKALATQRCVPSIKHVIVIGETNQTLEDGILSWEGECATLPRDRFNFNRTIQGEEIAAYFHTGGTTGTPKLAQHSHRAQVLNVCQMAMTGPNRLSQHGNVVDEVILCGLPLFHVNAVLVSSLSAILSGGELLLAGPMGFRNKVLMDSFWALIERYQVTFFSAVPTVYAALLEQDCKDYDLSSLSHCGCGAAPMPVSLLSAFRERTSADIIEGYGLTESMTCATTHYFYGVRQPGSIGMRIPYQQIRIVTLNDEGDVTRDCEVNEIGVLLLKGPNIIHGYKQAGANIKAWPERGWLNTGDMGRVDEQGYVWLTGRAKDLIIRGGHNIDPLLTENALTSHPAVEMAAAVGKPDSYAGEIPIAYVQLRSGTNVTPEELKVYAREHCHERAAAPCEIIICSELPQTAVGKTFKPELRKDAIARAYQQGAACAWAHNHFDTQVIIDDTHGFKVIVQAAATADELEDIVEAIAPEMDKLTYVWTLECQSSSQTTHTAVEKVRKTFSTAC
jgi:acyl-CoA synthetase (AMP-forming)/AMP-acid ligase II